MNINNSNKVRVGDGVHYVNPVGVPFNALVTAVWSDTCINVVIVSGDESKTDCYGRQIERYTSLCHKESMPFVHGNYWKRQDEELTPIKQPEK